MAPMAIHRRSCLNTRMVSSEKMSPLPDSTNQRYGMKSNQRVVGVTHTPSGKALRGWTKGRAVDCKLAT